MKRPVSISIITWIVIIYSALKLVLPIQAFFHMPAKTDPHMDMIMHQLMIDFAVSICTIIAAIGILRGRDNARWFFLIIQVLYWGYIFSMAGFQSVFTLPLLFSVVMLAVLFLPSSAQFFKFHSQSKAKEEQQ